MAIQGKRILLGVTGGIAAYKSPDIVRRLIERGAEVQVVMTAGAREFVGSRAAPELGLGDGAAYQEAVRLAKEHIAKGDRRVRWSLDVDPQEV